MSKEKGGKKKGADENSCGKSDLLFNESFFQILRLNPFFLLPLPPRIKNI